MTPKEKAKELVSKFNFEHLGDRYILHQTVEESKRCALIAVEEMIMYSKDVLHWMPCDNPECGCKEYWIKVKHEIEKL